MVGALIGGGISIIGGLIKMSRAKKLESENQARIDEYVRQSPDNAFASISVDSVGAELKREQSDALIATQLDALRKSGVRGVVGGVTPLAETSNKVGNEIYSDLSRQRADLNKSIAQDETRIRAIREARENADLAGLGNAVAVGRQNSESALNDIFSGIGMLVGVAGKSGGFGGLFGGNSSSIDMSGLQGDIFNSNKIAG